MADGVADGAAGGRRRLRDGLVGAAVAVLALGLVAVVGLWSLTTPAGDGGAPSSAADAPGSDEGGGDAAARPPADLAEGEVWLGDLVLDAGTVVADGSRLRDVHATGTDVRVGAAGLVAGTVAVDATVPFETVAAELGDGVTVAAGPDGQATVERSVRFAGRELRVVATGTVDVARGDLVVVPRTIDLGGPELLSGALAAVARRLVTIEHRIEGLPPGLRLRDVTVADDGFRAVLRGEDVRLTGAVGGAG